MHNHNEMSFPTRAVRRPEEEKTKASADLSGTDHETLRLFHELQVLRSELAVGLAHDFNNVLTAILGSISLARMHADQPDRVAQCLEQAENAAVRAKELTRRLLTFSMESVPGKEHTVHTSLSAAQVSEMPVPAAPQTLYNGAGRILLMDDEEMVRNIVTSMLEELGYLVECTKSGSEAIDLYRQRLAEELPFAAVIMDLVIPGGIGGKVAISSLLRIDPQTKVIVSSGYSEDAVLADYRGYGFSAVLSKPFRLKDLSRVLHELLGPAS